MSIDAPFDMPVGRLLAYDGDRNDSIKFYGSNSCIYVDEISGHIYASNQNCLSMSQTFWPYVCDSGDLCSKQSRAEIVPLTPQKVIPVEVNRYKYKDKIMYNMFCC